MRDGARHGHEAHGSAGADANADTDADAAAAFASRAQADHGDAIRDLIAVGDAVRGDDRGVHSSVELLVVLETPDADGGENANEDADGDGDDTEAADQPTFEEREQRLEALAETVGIEHEVVLEVYVLPAERVDAKQDHPLVREALEHGRSYV